VFSFFLLYFSLFLHTAGQAGLMLLYEIMFKNFDVACAQVLVTDDDFIHDISRANLKNTINTLLRLGVVPVINENDVVSLRSVSSFRILHF
jgi:glutamate 5-kinase